MSLFHGSCELGAEYRIGFSGNFRSFPEDFRQNHQSMGKIQLLFIGNSGHSDGAAGTLNEAAFLSMTLIPSGFVADK